MEKKFNDISTVNKLLIMGEIVLAVYFIFSLARDGYRTYQVDKLIEQFEADNVRLEKENQQKNEDFLYYISNEYADKIAKQNFGLINEGEEVIVVAADNHYVGLEDERINVARYQEDSNAKRWKRFIFGE